MKLLKQIILTMGLIVSFWSCQDESKDPMQTANVAKGTLLALRGTQLNNLYFNGVSGAAFFANNIKGTETWDVEAEFLSENKASLESIDIYVLKATKDASGKITKARVSSPLKTIPFSQFKNDGKYKGPWVAISIPLSEILSKIGMSPTSATFANDMFQLYTTYNEDTRVRSGGIVIETDLNLVGGAKVPSSLLVAPGLSQSDQFYPAQILTYDVQNVDDYRPYPSFSLRGQFVNKTTRPVLPLKSGKKDTLNIVFDQSIDIPPTVTLTPAGEGQLGSVVRSKDSKGVDLANTFYVTYETKTASTYTGSVLINVSGATSKESDVRKGLTSISQNASISIDNQTPTIQSFPSASTRLGKDGEVTLTYTFNEALGTAPTISLNTGTTNLVSVANAKMTLSSDKLSASYTYRYQVTAGATPAHGLVAISLSGGSDLAENVLTTSASSATFVVDIGTPPAPTITLDPKYDWGTQIKWKIDVTTGASNTGGSTTGTVYYVVLNSSDTAPDGFITGDFPKFTTGTTKIEKTVSSLPVSGGTSGDVFSPLLENGIGLKVYAVFVSNTGNVGSVSSGTTIDMN